MTRARPAPLHRRCFMAGLTSAGLAVGCKGGGNEYRFSGIPDGDKRELVERYDEVAQYLSQAMGKTVRYEHVPDYTAAVTALATGKIDFAWLGGVTTVQAEERTPKGIHFVAARARDLEFRSYFIGNAEVVAREKLEPVADRTPQTLADLAALAKVMRGHKFSFGAKSSTSGHVMPRAFLTSPEVGLDPERDFDGAAGFQLKGGHAATLRAVASGAVDFGVVNFAAWDEADPELQRGAPVLAVSPTFVDYCMVANGALSDAEAERLRKALTELDAGDASQRAVLEAFSAERFVSVDPAAWDGIRSVVEALESEGAMR